LRFENAANQGEAVGDKPMSFTKRLQPEVDYSWTTAIQVYTIQVYTIQVAVVSVPLTHNT